MKDGQLTYCDFELIDEAMAGGECEIPLRVRCDDTACDVCHPKDDTEAPKQ